MMFICGYCGEILVGRKIRKGCGCMKDKNGKRKVVK
jgi:hypothetical protein